MGHKRRGRFHFIFQYIGRSIFVFLASFIAADQKWFIDVRSRQYCVRLPEWNPVHTKEIAAPVKPVVLTYHLPAIIAVYPHFLRGLYFLFLARSHSRFGNLDGSGFSVAASFSFSALTVTPGTATWTGVGLRQSAICGVVQRSPGSRRKQCCAMSRKG